jgi:glutathione-specific gamma-glutamylcyclotransferase
MINSPPTGAIEAIGDAKRAESLRETMAGRPAGQPVRVFAYGSLLWDPCFMFDARESARLRGWTRRTCLWTVHARGSPEHPGLFYGLDAEPDGWCDGAVFTLRQEGLDQSLDALWRREMHAAVYTPRWFDLDAAGGTIQALGFVVNRSHPQYAGDIDSDTAAKYIAEAYGKFGSCADYYAATVASLRAEGLEDPDLVALNSRVAMLLNANGRRAPEQD